MQHIIILAIPSLINGLKTTDIASGGVRGRRPHTFGEPTRSVVVDFQSVDLYSIYSI
jgi:hypothetical protein